MQLPKNMNIFTMALIAMSFGFAFRLVDVATFETKTVKPALAVQDASQAHTPALKTPEEDEAAQIQKAVRDTAAQLGEDAPAKEAPPSAIAPIPDNRSYSAAELEVLQSLSKRRDDLEARERKVAESEALLRAAEQEVDSKIAELNKLKSEIEQLLGKQQGMEEARIVSLVKIYEAMKPKEAAAIFNTLDMDVLLEVVGRMNERKLSPILASMDTERARLVTIKLAEQRQLPDGSTPASTTP